MRITFIMPAAGTSGGNRVTAVYARCLLDRGHQVTVVSKGNKAKLSRRQKLMVSLGIAKRPEARIMPAVEALGQHHRIVARPGPITADDTPDADVVIATWWETAEWVAAFPPQKGRKFYLLQDYEMFPHLPTERVAATYHLPLKKIAVSRYIRNEITTRHGVDDITILPNGVDLGQFDAPPRPKATTSTFGFLYSTARRKAVHRAITALERVKAEQFDLQAIAFGAHPVDPALPLPGWITYRQDPPQDEIADIYAACDAWLFPTDTEGFGLPLLEAMACRTPVIATPAGAAPDLVDGHNGILVARSVDAFVNAIGQISDMSGTEWKSMSQAARTTAKRHDWKSATDRLERVLTALT